MSAKENPQDGQPGALSPNADSDQSTAYVAWPQEAHADLGLVDDDMTGGDT